MHDVTVGSRIRKWVAGFKRATRPAESPRSSSEFALEALEGRILLAADLSGLIQSATALDPAVPTNTASAVVQVQNSGNHRVHQSQVGVYASLDPVLDSADLLLGTANTDRVTAGQTKTLTVNLTLPNTLQPVDYTLLAKVDHANAIAENSETNNVAVGSTINGTWQFGAVPGRTGNTTLTLREADGTVVTFSLAGPGTGEVIKDGSQWDLHITGTTTGSAVTITTNSAGNGRVTLNDIHVVGPLAAFTAATTDLTGTLAIDGPVKSSGVLPGAITLRSVQGGTVAVPSVDALTILGPTTNTNFSIGAMLGQDGQPGGTGAHADTYGQGKIGLITVTGAMTNTTVRVGVDPVDGTYGNGNDQLIGGSASEIGGIVIGGSLSDDTRFYAGQFPTQYLHRLTLKPTAGDSHYITLVQADSDGDGILDVDERGGPNGGDANNDGIADSQQANVASSLNAVTNEYVTLVSSPGITLANLQASVVPPDVPADTQFPFGLFDFDLRGLTPGAAAQVTLTLPESTTSNTYYKFGPEADNLAPHWYEFSFDGTTGAQVAGNTITLHFVDGQRGDADLTADGAIVDPGGPAFEQESPGFDPRLEFSTFFGGAGFEGGSSIAVDAAGNIYMTGTTSASDFPTTNPAQGTFGGVLDAFVAKFNAAGSIVYATYLGGNGLDQARDIVVDGAGNAYIVGDSRPNENEPDNSFPTLNPFQGVFGGGEDDAFIAKFDATGALVYSTFLGGTGYDTGHSIDLDTEGNIYVTGQTTGDFPVINAAQPAQGGSHDAFVAKLNASGTSLVYSTYLGGLASDVGRDLAVDAVGNAYISGWTEGAFPAGSVLGSGGGQDVFVAKLDSTGGMAYRTVIGGARSDVPDGIAIDAAGNAFIGGYTNSSDFPTVNAVQSAFGGGQISHGGPPADGFVTKLNAAGNGLLYSTFLGGSAGDAVSDIALDAAGHAHVSGETNSTDFPTLNPLPAQGAVDARGDNNSAFVSQLNSAGTWFGYSTYLGGGRNESANSIAVDAAGKVYIVGSTFSSDFPIVSPLQGEFGGSEDVFISRISEAVPDELFMNHAPVLDPIGNRTINEDTLLTFTATATDANLSTQTLTFSLADGARGEVPEGATIEAATGLFRWTPTGQSQSSNTFDVVVSDGIVTDRETIQITVNIINDAPTAQASSVTTTAGQAKTFAVRDFGFTDEEENGLASITITGLTLADGDTLKLSGTDVTDGQTILAADIGNLVYTPAANASGSARSTFAFTVNDADSGTVAAIMTINISSVNAGSAPVAEADAATVAREEEVSVLTDGATSVLTNDRDDGLPGDPLTAILLSEPTSGALTLNADGTFRYLADNRFTGTVSFTYKANDGVLDSNVATVTITVT